MRLPPDLHAAIIDLDGTLVDTLGDFCAALNAVHAQLSLPEIGPEAVRLMVGKGSEHLIRSALSHVGADAQALYGAAWQAYQQHYLAINGRHSAVYPGAVEGLQRLKARGWRLACLTNKPGDFARPLLRDKGLAPFFDCIFGGDAFERKKPDPLPLTRTCQALSSAPARTLVVGDSSNDARAARAAGCPVVLVTYGYNHGEPVQAVDADGFLSSMAGLDSMLSPLSPAANP